MVQVQKQNNNHLPLHYFFHPRPRKAQQLNKSGQVLLANLMVQIQEQTTYNCHYITSSTTVFENATIKKKDRTSPSCHSECLLDYVDPYINKAENEHTLRILRNLIEAQSAQGSTCFGPSGGLMKARSAQRAYSSCPR